MDIVKTATDATKLIEGHGYLGIVVLFSSVVFAGLSGALVWMAKALRYSQAERAKIRQEYYDYLLTEAKKGHQLNIALMSHMRSVGEGERTTPDVQEIKTKTNVD